MAKFDQLSALEVSRKTRPGRYADGGGLYLQINPNGAKSWLFRYKCDGKPRAMGLGPLHAISLKDARNRAEECRRMRANGIDPMGARDEAFEQARLEAAKATTFKECAVEYIAANKPDWKNAKHIQQWENTLETYVYPLIGALSVQGVDTALVHKVLQQAVSAERNYPAGTFWKARPETANRVRGRIEMILDWASVSGYRHGENPARWRGHLDKVYRPKSAVQRTEHHKALPIDDVAAFVANLRERDCLSGWAFEFMILTVKRTVEVLGAKWDEIDTRQKVWTISAARMKGKIGITEDHRVPLTPAALAILEKVRSFRCEGDYVFPGNKEGKPLSNMVFLTMRDRMGRKDDFTPHGFRSTFRDWAAERTNYPREVAEKALAHALEDKTEAAYQRADLLERRRPMMEAWAKHCTTKRRGEVGDLSRRRA